MGGKNWWFSPLAGLFYKPSQPHARLGRSILLEIQADPAQSARSSAVGTSSARHSSVNRGTGSYDQVLSVPSSWRRGSQGLRLTRKSRGSACTPCGRFFKNRHARCRYLVSTQPKDVA